MSSPNNITVAQKTSNVSDLLGLGFVVSNRIYDSTSTKYSITSLIRTPTDGQNVLALSGVRINRSNIN